MLPTKFRVNWPFGSGGEAKNRFSRWPPWRSTWISDRNDFSYFWPTSHPDSSYQVSSQLAQGCRRSRLLKQLLTLHDERRTLTDHNSSLEHFVLRWANNAKTNATYVTTNAQTKKIKKNNKFYSKTWVSLIRFKQKVMWWLYGHWMSIGSLFL